MPALTLLNFMLIVSMVKPSASISCWHGARLVVESGRQKSLGCDRALIHKVRPSSGLHGTTMRTLRCPHPAAIAQSRYPRFPPFRLLAAIAALLDAPMEPPFGAPLALCLPPIHGAVIRATS